MIQREPQFITKIIYSFIIRTYVIYSIIGIRFMTFPIELFGGSFITALSLVKVHNGTSAFMPFLQKPYDFIPFNCYYSML